MRRIGRKPVKIFGSEFEIVPLTPEEFNVRLSL
jgi:hypothetical protein